MQTLSLLSEIDTGNQVCQRYSLSLGRIYNFLVFSTSLQAGILRVYDIGAKEELKQIFAHKS